MRVSYVGALAIALVGAVGSVNAQGLSGVYVTGSAGLAMPRDAGIKNDPDTATGVLNSPGGTLNDLDRSPVYGLGVGYRISPMFRADVSLSLRSGLDLSDSEGDPATGTAGRNDTTAKIRSRAVFLTGYVDAGSLLPAQYSWINPYVGAGVGYAVNRLSSLTNTSTVTGLGTDTTTSAPSGTGRGLAWQIAAGLGFEVSRSLALDVGYRYVDLGRLKVDRGIYDYPGTVGEVASNGLKGDLTTHEVVVGLRYSF